VITRPFPVVTTRSARGGFTLAELLVSVFVVAIIILMVTQLMTSATAVSRTGNKHIDTDTQARIVLDRMAMDFAQMLKRTDVDYYVKGPTNYSGHGGGHGWGHRLGTGQLGSDQIAFFTQVPAYNDTNSSFQSPLSLVAYRVNQGSSTGNPSYLRLERMGKGLLWNGASNGTNQSAIYPIVFLPQTIGAVGSWSAAINNFISGNTSLSQDPDYETIGPGVFRFEYYYLLKNGRLTDVPWDRDARPNQTSLTNPEKIGLKDVESIAVAIAAIDPASRALINSANANTPTVNSLLDLASDMDDFATAPGRGNNGAKRIGDMEYQWKTVVETIASTGMTSLGSPVPPEAAKAIRIYNRYFDLKSL
jgi:prepilin-type N-terminal cleavage/methylation domain-containing protein